MILQRQVSVELSSSPKPCLHLPVRVRNTSNLALAVRGAPAIYLVELLQENIALATAEQRYDRGK